MNDIGVDGVEALAAVIPGSALRCIIAGKFCGVRDGVATGVEVKKGVFAAVEGRFGQITQDPEYSEVKLRWLDDGRESDYTKVDKLSSVVASSSDLVIGSRIPVNDPEVTELNYQGQLIGPAEVILIAAATSTLAAVTEIDVRQNPGIDEASLAALRAAAEETGCAILAPTTTEPEPEPLPEGWEAVRSSRYVTSSNCRFSVPPTSPAPATPMHACQYVLQPLQPLTRSHSSQRRHLLQECEHGRHIVGSAHSRSPRGGPGSPPLGGRSRSRAAQAKRTTSTPVSATSEALRAKLLPHVTAQYNVRILHDCMLRSANPGAWVVMAVTGESTFDLPTEPAVAVLLPASAPGPEPAAE
eukprot:COSAG06_NODE_14803_length_1124_cov_1.736585_1_plen_355_part_01